MRAIETGQNRMRETMREKCTSEVFVHDPSHPEITEQIVAAARIIETSRPNRNPWGSWMFRNEFTSPDSTLVLLRSNVAKRVVGFTYARPAPAIYADSEVSFLYAGERSLDPQTAYICHTALHAGYSGQGRLPGMLRALYKALGAKGFQYIERDATTKNGYAEKVISNLGEDVIGEPYTHRSMYGEQVFIRHRVPGSAVLQIPVDKG
jgi:ribosomal protein S18 acetylase RimI-like enzyme